MLNIAQKTKKNLDNCADFYRYDYFLMLADKIAFTSDTQK